MLTIIGTDDSGKVVAEDKTPDAWKAELIAATWRGHGLEVEIQNT